MHGTKAVSSLEEMEREGGKIYISLGREIEQRVRQPALLAGPSFRPFSYLTPSGRINNLFFYSVNATREYSCQTNNKQQAHRNFPRLVFTLHVLSLLSLMFTSQRRSKCRREVSGFKLFSHRIYTVKKKH